MMCLVCVPNFRITATLLSRLIYVRALLCLERWSAMLRCMSMIWMALMSSNFARTVTFV